MEQWFKRLKGSHEWPGNHESGYKKSIQWTTEGLQVDLSENLSIAVQKNRRVYHESIYGESSMVKFAMTEAENPKWNR